MVKIPYDFPTRAIGRVYTSATPTSAAGAARDPLSRWTA
jgi:hypothetical protein